MSILTIIFPSRNRLLDLKSRLNEIRDFDEIEIIIVDDFSENKYNINPKENIKIIRNQKNLGRGNSILKALNLVNTKFVSIFDDDDFIHKSGLKKIIKKLESLDSNIVGIIAETNQNSEVLPKKLNSYLYYRFNSEWRDKKEFVRSEILKKNIPSWLRGRRIPTSFLFSLCDSEDNIWAYENIKVVNKIYKSDGLTATISKNPFKKSLHITLIYWVYRKFKLIFYEN